MEPHPVPQNVTNFEFHLVGDMTLKQFIYLASGLSSAYLLFAFLAEPLPLIAWPLIVVLAATGVAFAFLPIAERPLDHWAGAYFKAIFSPQQRVWASQRKDISRGDPIFNKRLNIYLASVNLQPEQAAPIFNTTPKMSSMAQYAPATQQVVSPVLEPSTAPAPPLSQAPFPSPPPPTPNQPQVEQASQPLMPPTPVNPLAGPVIPEEKAQPEHIPDAEELIEIVDLAKQSQMIQEKITGAEEIIDQIKTQAATPGANLESFTDKFQSAVRELQTLTKNAKEISHKLAVLSQSEAEVSSRVTVVPAIKKEPSTKLVLTSVPNVINGVVTDSQNSYIEGVIVVTHDKEGLPVRALKTNKLGQFVAATPLPNGTYTVTLEKDNLVFDNLQVELDNMVLPPIKISAKKMEPIKA